MIPIPLGLALLLTTLAASADSKDCWRPQPPRLATASSSLANWPPGGALPELTGQFRSWGEPAPWWQAELDPSCPVVAVAVRLCGTNLDQVMMIGGLPTDNALLISFLLSSDAEILLISTD